jgi:hypothetical protein
VPNEPLPPSAELRASDAERAHAVELLSRAVADGRLSVEELDGRLQSAYDVRTRRELATLIADVSTDTALDQPISPSSLPVGVKVVDGPGGSGWVVSILGGHDRRGYWRIARTCTVLNVLGGSDIDLCDVELAGPETQLNVYSFMGGSEIRVPSGVRVEVTKLAVLGGNEVDLGTEQPRSDAPLVRVRIVSVMSGCSVRRGHKQSRAERRQARAVRKAKRRGELDA